MKKVGDLLSRDLRRKIEEIIQVDQADEQPVYEEITEYVATASIKDHFYHLLNAMAEAPSEPHEGIGVWVSGFFGSGKSSFVKYLGYALQNRKFLGHPFAELFKQQIGDQRISDLLDLINHRIPTDVLLFDVAKERDTRRTTERIAELLYARLLQHLDYAEDFDIAELEIELEAEGRLDEFIRTCLQLHGQDWRIIRKGAQKISRASAVLHHLDPKTYPSADSWAHSLRNREAIINVRKVVERAFELWQRRRPGKAMVIIIDEVGQYVAHSTEKIEDLRATVEEFGKVGKNLLRQRKILAPCWVIVTSQEKLDEVVAALDSRRVELAKLQDRFRHRIDLAPSDIREVATRRVLTKKPQAVPLLKNLFAQHHGALNAALRLERTSRRTDLSEADFIQFYPYPPHYIDICISIMSGIRLQPGAPRHLGGSNRTIIKQAYEMLVSERTALADKPIGTLVTLDKVYELVEGNLSNEKRTDIHEIYQRFKKDPDDKGWTLRVAKVICLLEFVRDLPRTEANIAAFLVDEVGKPAPLAEVQQAVQRLHKAHFIRNTEEGWKLQTAQEKNWETERRGHLDPRPRERHELLCQVLKQVFDEQELKTYRHQNLRSFRVGLKVEGSPLGDDGDLSLNLIPAEDDADFARRLAEISDDSRHKDHANDLYWAFLLTPSVEDLIKQIYASRKMIEKYDQLRVQNRITDHENACLQDEKSNEERLRQQLQEKLLEALAEGVGVFRGLQKEAASLGKNLPEIMRNLFELAVPAIYPKLEIGARPLRGDEAELLLKAADLKALPGVFYAGDNGLGLVVKQGARQVINTSAPTAKEVLDYLKSEHSYGNRESCLGKALERHFGSSPYGWEPDIVRLVLAALFRAGEIEITYQGMRYTTYQDAACRICFTRNPAFRASLFTPRQTLDLKTLSQAANHLEALLGEEVDVEEGAIAAALKGLASAELERLTPLKARAEALRLPVASFLADSWQTWSNLNSAASEECVRILADTGQNLLEQRHKVRNLEETLTPQNLETLRQAQRVVEQAWPRLSAYQPAPEVAQAVQELQELLASEDLADALSAIAAKTRIVLDAYRKAYLDLFDRRAEAYRRAIDHLCSRPEWEPWARSNPAKAEAALAPLVSRLGTDEDRSAVESGSALGKATLTEMESDLAAVESLKQSALRQLQDAVLASTHKTAVRRVRIAELLDRPLQSREDLEAALARLRDTLQKLLDEGNTVLLE